MHTWQEGYENWGCILCLIPPLVQSDYYRFGLLLWLFQCLDSDSVLFQFGQVLWCFFINESPFSLCFFSSVLFIYLIIYIQYVNLCLNQPILIVFLNLNV